MVETTFAHSSDGHCPVCYGPHKGRDLADRKARVHTPGRLSRVPNQPKTPVRGFRIPDELYRAAQAKAEERGEDLSTVIRAALERYVKRK